MSSPRPTWRLATLLLFAGLLVLQASGCARHRVDGQIVRNVQFRGNGGGFQGAGDYLLRTAMAQPRSGSFSWLAPSRRVSLDQDTLLLDAWRVETWLAHHGYLDARFRAWDVITLRPPNARRGAVVRVIGHVELGPQTRVRTMELAGIEQAGRPILALLRAQAPLQPGATFDLEDLRASEELVAVRLQEQGYAYVTVRSEVQLFPEEQAADVVLHVDLGPPCTFGALRLVGDTTIRRETILAEIDVKQGEPWRRARLNEVQQRLFALGTFSVVNVVPELAWDADGAPIAEVPVRIELAEAGFRQLRVGGGLTVENARQEVRAGATFSHVNLGNRLWRLQVGAEVGYASLIELRQGDRLGFADLATQGAPIAETSASLTIPRFPAHDWRLENQLSFELGLEPEYRFATPEGSTALSWQIHRKWSARLGYKVRYFDYFDSSLPEDVSLLDRRGRQLDLDFSDPYLLSSVFQQLKYDSRDDLFFPRRGSLSVLDLAEAGGPFGGQYNFVKILADGRIYRPLPGLLGWHPRITLTARLAGGALLPYGAEERAQVPFAERISIGGASTVRGWAQDHLGPYLYECQDAETGEVLQCSSAVDQDQPFDGANNEDDDIIYIGGKAALYGGLEARGYWQRGLLSGWGLAGFMDFGRAWDGAGVSSWADLRARASQIAVSVGGGVRYKSPVGPIRVDLARRLDQFPMFSNEPRVALHIGLSEAW